MAKRKSELVKTKRTKKSQKSPARCGDCKHYKRGPRLFEDKCKNIGIHKDRLAPSCFSPDLLRLSKVDKDIIKQLGELTKELTPSQNRILSHLFHTVSKINSEKEFYLGQEVYFCLGEDYLTHYFKGYVLDHDSKEGYVFITAKLRKAKKNTMISMPIESVMDYDTFQEKAKSLVDSGKVAFNRDDLNYWRAIPLVERMDKKGRVKIEVKEEISYEAPSIDKAPEDMLKPKKKKKRSHKPMYEELENGVMFKLRTKK